MSRTPRQLAFGAALALLLAADPLAAAGLEEIQAGNASFAAGRHQEAVDAFTRGIEAGDLELEALAIAFNNRGVAQGELGRFDQAISDYQEALRLKPNDATSIKNLRIAHLRRGGGAAAAGDVEAALRDYDRAVELEPQHPLSYLRRGQLRLSRGEAAAALTDLEMARRLDPANPDVASLLQQAQQAAVEPAAAPLGPPPVLESAPAPPAPSLSPSPTATASAPPEPPPPAAAPPPVAVAAAPPSVPSPAPPPPAAAAPASPPPAAAAPASEGGTTRMIATADVNIRSGPGNSFAPSGTLARGTVVTVLDQRLGWHRIRLANGQEGFVYRRWLAAEGTAQR